MWANLWALDEPLTFEEHMDADKCIKEIKTYTIKFLKDNY